ncbi:hypothetical protein FJ414_21410 [Mesorhizobium sp. B3-1-6]|nr:hypothetical protein FJ414_21410 [Mesorhizobium sp. B3-1-6]TPI57672.1 hypothetical protein FJ417_21440 [Mesorhizobium sp. B3-1-7]TPJ37231.1 hypothetical protein FJ418_01550 [Mesorhizobium sp. B2-8-3]
MSRHGMVQPSAAGTQPPAADRHTSMVMIDSDRAAPGRPPSRQHRAEAQRSGLSVFTPEFPGRAIADICQNPKSP